MHCELVTHKFRAMGGPCEIHVWCKESHDAPQIFAELESEVKRLDKKYSRYSETSLLSKLNRNDLGTQLLDEETIGLLNYADDCFELSGHIFDPTVGILRQIWDYNKPQLPISTQVRACLENVGWKKLGWNGRSLIVPENMELDFGGLVKEFAVDRLIVLLNERNLSGLVNLSGDVAVSRNKHVNHEWKLAIVHPRKRSASFASIALEGGSLASSGDYERFIEVNGKRYCHLLRPDTGFPVEDSFTSVSVVATSCLMAGTVSTIAMLKGKSEGLEWLEEMSLPYLAIDQSLRTYGTIEVLD